MGAEPLECAKCHLIYPADSVEDDLCRGCHAEWERIRADVTRLRPHLDRDFPAWLQKCGMGTKEIGAEPKRIPGEIVEAIRPYISTAMIAAGSGPERGFGLTGYPGAGKTFTLAAMFKSALHDWVYGKLEVVGSQVYRSQWFTWVNWPTTIAKMRAQSMREFGLQDVQGWVEKWCTVQLLVLDDLGAERIRGSYIEDAMASQLDVVVDERERSMLPTWYTTNLNEKELIARYGGRLFSRLCVENPLLTLPPMKDLRGRPRGTSSSGGAPGKASSSAGECA